MSLNVAYNRVRHIEDFRDGTPGIVVVTIAATLETRGLFPARAREIRVQRGFIRVRIEVAPSVEVSEVSRRKREERHRREV